MSAITAPSTSFGTQKSTRTPLIVGAAAAIGILAVGAVVLPRVTTHTTSTTPTVTVNQHDAVEHQRDVTAAQHATSNELLRTRAVQQRLDLEARQRAAAVGVATATGAGSLARQQVGGMAPTFTWSTGGRTTWTDTYVPPTDNPEWVPFIKKHYFSNTVTPSRPTHEFH